jgi:hypothetical protein
MGMVASKNVFQRRLHSLVGMMRGRYNTCLTQRKDGSFAPKVDYKSQESAARSAVALTDKFGREFDAYQCWYCKGWHIGGAANLTLWKFLSIMLVWMQGKRRENNKYRLKAYERYKPVICPRCGKETLSTILSMYNTQEICKACEDAEKERPDYNAAVEADKVAVKAGDYNFKGMGLK